MPVFHIHCCRAHLLTFARYRKQRCVDHLDKWNWSSTYCISCLDWTTRCPQFSKADATSTFGDPHSVTYTLGNWFHIIINVQQETVTELREWTTSIDAGWTTWHILQATHVIVKINCCSCRIFFIVAQPHGDAHVSKLWWLNWLTTMFTQSVAVTVSYNTEILTKVVFSRIKRFTKLFQIKPTVGHPLVQ